MRLSWARRRMSTTPNLRIRQRPPARVRTRSAVMTRPRKCRRARTSAKSSRLATKAGRAADDVPASAPVGRRSRPIDIKPGTNAPAEIGGRPYSGHALDRMQGRGIPPSAVDDVISGGQGVAGRAGTRIHYSVDNHLSVVLGRNGRVVTVGYGRFKP